MFGHTHIVPKTPTELEPLRIKILAGARDIGEIEGLDLRVATGDIRCFEIDV